MKMSTSAPQVPQTIIDFAPGEKHIFLRDKIKNYYVPELFHLAPTVQSGIIVPLLIKDVVNSKSPIDIYGFAGMVATNDNYMVVNNFPIKSFKIQGKLVGEQIKTFDNKSNLVFIQLDDSSGHMITVKIVEALYLLAGLKFGCNYGFILEVSGHLEQNHLEKEIVSSHIEIKGRATDIDIEISFLKSALDYRDDVLSKPWVYTPASSNVTSNEAPRVKYTREYHEIKRVREALVMTDPVEEPTSAVVDSLLVAKEFNSRSERQRISSSTIEHEKENKPLEIVDLTSEDDTCSVQSLDLDSEIMNTPLNSTISSVKVTSELKLKFALIKWIIKRNETFKLHELYKNFAISRILNQLSDIKFLQQNVSYSNGKDHCLSKTEMKRMIFHEARHYLTASNLISCSKRQSCHPVNLLNLKGHIEKCLLLIKSVKQNTGQTVVFDCHSYMNKYSKRYQVSMEPKLVSEMINWILYERMREENWVFNEKSLQWMFSPKVNTTKKVLNRRKLAV